MHWITWVFFILKFFLHCHRMITGLTDYSCDRILLRPFKFVGKKILWAVGQVEPSTLQLATSPSTSAVQDRVLQAAAKHGPLASESELEQNEEVEILGAEKEGEAVAETEVETLSSLSIQEPLPVQSSLDGVPPPPPPPPATE